jgi:hypothetical protein
MLNRYMTSSVRNRSLFYGISRLSADSELPGTSSKLSGSNYPTVRSIAPRHIYLNHYLSSPVDLWRLLLINCSTV